MQAAVYGEDLAGGFAETFRHQQEVALGLVFRRDGRLGQRTVGIKLGEFGDERVGGFGFRERNVVFGE